MAVRATRENGGMASGILRATLRAALATLLLVAAAATGIYFLLR